MSEFKETMSRLEKSFRARPLPYLKSQEGFRQGGLRQISPVAWLPSDTKLGSQALTPVGWRGVGHRERHFRKLNYSFSLPDSLGQT